MAFISRPFPAARYRALAAALSGLLLAAAVHAETIRSTTIGGPWHQGSTWIGGVAPSPDDDVIVDGPVRVHGTAACANLETTLAGTVGNGAGAPSTLEVASGIVNAGSIEDAQYSFYIRLGGDLNNQGSWTNRETTFTGTSDQHVSQSATAVFESHLARDPSATGDVLVDTPFAILGNVDLEGGRVILGPDCPLILRGGFFSSEILCQGNEVRFEEYSYLLRGVMDAGVLVGQARASSAFSFTSGLTVMDALTHSSGGAHIRIDGDLVNYGLVHNETYGLTIDLSGNLEGYGIFTNSYIALDGSQTHHLRMNLDGNLDTDVILPEFEASTIVVETDARISDGFALGIDGTMILQPGVSLRLTGGSIGGGTLLGQGNDIYMEHPGVLALDRAENVILHGAASIYDGTGFTGGLQVVGTLQNWQFAASEITVDGTLVNDGQVRDNVQTFTIRARGDIVNHAVLENSRVVLDGTEDQMVDMGQGIDVPEFVLTAGFTATGYQWFRDGSPLLGEQAAELVFVTLNAGDSGTYRCEGAQGQVSRAIEIGPGLATEAPEPAVETLLSLAPVWPNPIRGNGGAAIEFFLPAEGRTRLSIFDVAGREVSVLLAEQLGAGRQVTSWTPVGAASGVYFVRLNTPSGTAQRRVTLID